MWRTGNRWPTTPRRSPPSRRPSAGRASKPGNAGSGRTRPSASADGDHHREPRPGLDRGPGGPGSGPHPLRIPGGRDVPPCSLRSRSGARSPPRARPQAGAARGSGLLRSSLDLRCARRPAEGVGTKGVPPNRRQEGLPARRRTKGIDQARGNRKPVLPPGPSGLPGAARLSCRCYKHL